VVVAIERDLLGERRARLGRADRRAALAQPGQQPRHRILERDERSERVERDHASHQATQCQVAKIAV
jgi:hypothetical protein